MHSTMFSNSRLVIAKCSNIHKLSVRSESYLRRIVIIGGREDFVLQKTTSYATASPVRANGTSASVNTGPVLTICTGLILRPGCPLPCVPHREKSFQTPFTGYDCSDARVSSPAVEILKEKLSKMVGGLGMLSTNIKCLWRIPAKVLQAEVNSKGEELGNSYVDKIICLSILLAFVAFGHTLGEKDCFNVYEALSKLPGLDFLRGLQNSEDSSNSNGNSAFGGLPAIMFTVAAGDCVAGEEGVVDPRLVNFMRPFVLTEKQLKDLYCTFQKEIDKGLDKNTHKNADIKCWPTYITKLPTGEEEGKYLALDMGGTNFRILLVELKGRSEPSMKSEIYEVPKALISSGKCNEFFDFIAECLHSFVKKQKVENQPLPLSFTFSFPCEHQGLKKATLIRWTKGYNVSGVVGKDVGALLREAIKRREGLQAELVAILNDTSATLISCAHKNPNCRIGVIVGTGHNAAYFERTECICKLDEELRKRHPQMVINLECGAFGDSGNIDFVRTQYDKHIDKHSMNKGIQTFEKMVAGMYLGELVRLILYCAIQKELVFDRCGNRQEMAEVLAENVNIIECEHISEIEQDGSDFKNTKKFIKKIFGMSNPSNDDCQKIKYICQCIGQRSATMVSIALSALVNRIEDKCVVVGIDGSLYRFHPKYDSYMRTVMDKYVAKGKTYDIVLSKDGSGRGAAVVAALASGSKNVVQCNEKTKDC